MLDLASQHAEGDGNRLCLANNNSANKCETQEPLRDKLACASLPAGEVAKTQDYQSPQPITEGKNDPLPVCTSELCCTEDTQCSE